MRLALIATILAVSTAPALAAGCHIPGSPRPPNVYTDVYWISSSEVHRVCQSDVNGCGYPLHTAAHPDRWVIVVNNALLIDDAACIIECIKAQMPPNRVEAYLMEEDTGTKLRHNTPATPAPSNPIKVVGVPPIR